MTKTSRWIGCPWLGEVDLSVWHNVDAVPRESFSQGAMGYGVGHVIPGCLIISFAVISLLLTVASYERKKERNCAG